MRSVADQLLTRIAVGLAVVVASFAFTSAAVYLWFSPAARSENLIHITEATYGGNCSGSMSPAGSASLVRAGNATVAAGQSCNDTDVLCPVVVDAAKIGDPAVWCSKDFAVSWRCGSERTIHHRALPAEARGAIAWLSCPATD
jgi:hypothetical protein